MRKNRDIPLIALTVAEKKNRVCSVIIRKENTKHTKKDEKHEKDGKLDIGLSKLEMLDFYKYFSCFS